MAEAIVTKEWADSWQAYSAGTRPAGYVHPKALAALKEIGIDWTGKSQHSDGFRQLTFDKVITVCDNAAEDCPVWLGQGTVVHSSFP